MFPDICIAGSSADERMNGVPVPVNESGGCIEREREGGGMVKRRGLLEAEGKGGKLLTEKNRKVKARERRFIPAQYTQKSGWTPGS